jgi:uncharacterized membrane protein
VIHVNIRRLRSRSATVFANDGTRIARFAASGGFRERLRNRPMPSAGLPPLIVDSELCVVSRRNDSLGTRGRFVAFAVLAAVSAVVAIAWTVAGAWMVLPYSVVEVALVGIAFAHAGRRAGDWERLVVVGNRVIVERSRGGRQTRQELDRWRMRIETAGRHLVLCAAGERVAFGGGLGPAERAAAGRDLRRLTRL